MPFEWHAISLFDEMLDLKVPLRSLLWNDPRGSPFWDNTLVVLPVICTCTKYVTLRMFCGHCNIGGGRLIY